MIRFAVVLAAATALLLACVWFNMEAQDTAVDSQRKKVGEENSMDVMPSATHSAATAPPRVSSPYTHYERSHKPHCLRYLKENLAARHLSPVEFGAEARVRCLGIITPEHLLAKFKNPVAHWDQRAHRNATLISPNKAWDVATKDPEPNSPLNNVIHGGVSPRRLLLQTRVMAQLMRLRYLDYPPLKNDTAAHEAVHADGEDVIVELGCGNGNLLYWLCPPSRAVHCFGSDISPRMIEEATAWFPHIRFWHEVGVSQLPDACATAVLSHGVFPYLDGPAACMHIAEGLRVLRRGGVMVGWMIAQHPFHFRTHPTFFVDDDEATRFLPFCTGLHRFVARVDLLQNYDAPVYPAKPGFFYGVRIWRNGAPMPKLPELDANSPKSTGELRTDASIVAMHSLSFITRMTNASLEAAQTVYQERVRRYLRMPQ